MTYFNSLKKLSQLAVVTLMLGQSATSMAADNYLNGKYDQFTEVKSCIIYAQDVFSSSGYIAINPKKPDLLKSILSPGNNKQAFPTVWKVNKNQFIFKAVTPKDKKEFPIPLSFNPADKKTLVSKADIYPALGLNGVFGAFTFDPKYVDNCSQFYLDYVATYAPNKLNKQKSSK